MPCLKKPLIKLITVKRQANIYSKMGLLLLVLINLAMTNTVLAGNNKPKIKIYNELISVPVFSIETNKKFDDVMEDLLVSIADNNFRLTQHARIGKAIAERNGKPFPFATVVHFCNLNYAKQLLELAPDYLLRMPCRISVWPDNDGNNIIKVWLLPEDDERTADFAKKINAILKSIVTYSAN